MKQRSAYPQVAVFELIEWPPVMPGGFNEPVKRQVSTCITHSDPRHPDAVFVMATAIMGRDGKLIGFEDAYLINQNMDYLGTYDGRCAWEA